MKIHPKQDWMLVDPCEFDQGRQIQLADVSRDAPDRGVVVETGPDVWGYERGDIILFGKYCGVPSEDDRVLVRARDVVATVTDVKLVGKKTFDVSGQVHEAPRLVPVGG